MKASNILMLACVVFSINVRQTTSQGGGLMQGLVDFAMLNPVDPNAAGPVPLDSAFPPDTSFPTDAFPPDTGPSSDPSSSAGPFPPETVAQVNTGLPLNQRQTDINPPRNTDVLPPGISLDPLTPVDPAWQTNSLPPNDGTPIDSNFPSDPFSSNAGMPIDPVSQTDPFSSNAGMPIDPVSQTDPFSSNAGMPIDPFSQTDPFSSNAGMPIDPVSQTDPFSSNTGMPIDPVSQTDPFSSNTGMPIDPVSQTDPFSSNAGMPIDPVSQTDPMQTNDGIPLDPAFQEDPFAADPFASDPFGPDPFASDPFASDASASVRDATTITEGSPFFRFLPNIPPGSAFVSLNDGTTNTFQPTDNWIGEKPVGAGKLDQNAIDPNVADTPQTKVESIIPSKDVGTVPIGSSPMSPPVPATGGQHNAMKDWVVPVKEAKQSPVPIFPMASPDATNVEPVVSANGPVVDSHAIPLGPENPNAIPIWQVDPNAVPLGPVDSNAIPLGPVDPNAIPLGPVDLNTIPLGPVVDQNARPLRPLVDPDPVSLRPVVDTNAIPLGPIFATPVNLSPVDRKQNQGQSPGASSDVPGNWMQLYTRDRKRPRRLPPVQQEVSEPLPLTPTDNLMAQASLNSFTRNRGLYRRLREERRQARRQRKLERQRQKQQQRQQKKERKQARNQRLENRGSIGRVVTSTGPVGAKVARMIIPGQNRPFVGKRQRGRRMVPPCTQRRQQRGLCSPGTQAY